MAAVILLKVTPLQPVKLTLPVLTVAFMPKLLLTVAFRKSELL